MRFIAQRVLTGQFLDWDVPIALSSAPRRDLSGPGSLEGTVEVEYARLIGSDGLPILDEWSTAIYAEESGEIRWGGLLVSSTFEGGAWNIECAGFTTYPHGIPYLGESIQAGVRDDGYVDPYEGKDLNNDGYVDNTTPPRSVPIPDPPPGTYSPLVDAFDVVRAIWDHLQAQPDGNLGVVVDTQMSGHMLGTKDGSDPYELAWWEAPDCGAEIDNLAQQAPFDYFEEHTWVPGGTETISHRLRLAYPRVGRKRTDLRFAAGENLTAVLTPERSGDDFANEVFGIGKGEGRNMLNVRIPRLDGRLRRVHVLSDKSIGQRERLDALARKELSARAGGPSIPMIAVMDHPNAPMGSWRPGDDILVQAEVPWLGDVSIWHRVVSDQFLPDGTAVLSLVRTDLFESR